MSTVSSIAEAPRRAPSSRARAAVPALVRGGFRGSPYLIIAALATLLALATASECHSVTSLPSLLYGAVLWGWWGAVAGAIWKQGATNSLLTAFSAASAVVHLLLGSALGAMHLLLLGGLGYFLEGGSARAAVASWTSLLNVNRFGLELLLYGFVLGIAGIVRSQILAQREAMRALDLERQLSVAHLRALQMQMEPHFLLNTLNAITTLVELGRQEQAAEMLAHLNAMLKSTLQRTTPEKVPLAQELELVENYLAIEQARFADRLQIAIKVDPTALDGLVPCFLLQPIIENAIRHGIAQCEQAGTVEASVRREGSSLHLHVRDTGAGFNGTDHNQSQVDKPPQQGHGIGLSNTRERLAHFYAEGYAMRAQPMDAGGFEVAITIPYERAAR